MSWTGPTTAPKPSRSSRPSGAKTAKPKPALRSRVPCPRAPSVKARPDGAAPASGRQGHAL
eukprot:510199-Lingulodinium_polyedra.AAC.1